MREKRLIYSLVTVIIIFLAPIIIKSFPLAIPENFIDYGKVSIIRSLAFSLMSALCVTFFAFALSISLEAISFSSTLGKSLSFMLLPLSLGNLSTAFIFKMALYNSSLFESIISKGGVTVFLALLIIQIWQYGFVFAYMLWMGNSNIKSDRLNYFKTIKSGLWLRVRDLYLPNSKNLLLLLFVICFMYSFYEDAKIVYLFKASEGNNTELISAFLLKTYRSISLISPKIAIRDIFTSSMIILSMLIIILGFLIFSFSFILRKISKITLRVPKLTIKSKMYSNLLLWISIGLIFCPIIIALSKMSISFTNSIIEVFRPFLFTLLAALILTVISIFFSIALRISFPNKLNSFDNKSLVFFLLLLVLNIIPPITILTTGFFWIRVVNSSFDVLVYSTWIFGQVLLNLPILSTFLLVTYFSVNNTELTFLRVHRASNRNIIKASFISRFKVEHILMLIFAFSFIWNESIINNVFSDKIKSFSYFMKMYVSGKSADNSKAFAFLLISFLISFLCVVLWRRVLNKIIEYKNK